MNKHVYLGHEQSARTSSHVAGSEHTATLADELGSGKQSFGMLTVRTFLRYQGRTRGAIEPQDGNLGNARRDSPPRPYGEGP